MAYDEKLADRVRALLEPGPFTEKKMFGGLAFLLRGHMAVTVSGRGGIMVRVDPDEGRGLLDGTAVTPMVMAGREVDGWLRVSAAAVADDTALRTWVARGTDFVATLPPK
ncbi:TfoX/Sxy family protein [Nocardia harenae]|uniref:TfoX/Sxy family protein n=1 Tax=Nocardia harenae TaxID=358707 RepID=UPI000833C567|nr:TfoX/Sxy family protein [Nocardia harenae]